MPRSPRTRPEKGFLSYPRHRILVELVLDYDRPTAVMKAQECARKILDGLDASSAFELPDGFAGASLKCGTLRRLVKIRVREPDEG